MKKIALILVLSLTFAVIMTACGEKTPPVSDTTPAVTDPVTDPIDGVTTQAPATDAPATTETPETDAPVTVDLLYGKWTLVGAEATIEITKDNMTETDGKPVTFDYTVKSQTVDGDNNLVCVIYANDSEYTYIVYKAKAGYGDYSYMEIVTNKLTLAYAK